VDLKPNHIPSQPAALTKCHQSPTQPKIFESETLREQFITIWLLQSKSHWEKCSIFYFFFLLSSFVPNPLSS